MDKVKTFTIALSAITTLHAGAQAPAQLATQKAAADIKPALTKDNFDEEKMRLVKMIHKRIIERQKASAKTPSFAAYQETMQTGVKFEMLPVKGGSFTWKGEQEGDVLEVTLSPFWIGKTEVTWDEYDPFMRPKIPRLRSGKIDDIRLKEAKHEIDFLARPTVQYHPVTHHMPSDGYPAISMTQHAANKYCQWLSYHTGHFYRLPTEAEWDYACRAGSKTKYYWGDNAAEANKYAWLASEQYQKPAQKKPNAWGIHDMHGNVLEWTLDQYVPNRFAYFGKKKVTDPWIKATKPYPHVVKGSHWEQKHTDITSTARHQSAPEWKESDSQDPKTLWFHTSTPWLGMRIVRPVKIPTVEEMYHYWNSGVEYDE